MTAPRIAWVNGTFVPLEEAKISITDRGLLFGDGVYEVAAVLDGKLVELDAHLDRLERSCREIALPLPLSRAELAKLLAEVVARNALVEGAVYLQVTRGPAERDFAPPKAPAPSLFVFTQERSILASPAAERGVAVITVPDLRWKRRDIKSTSLLAQVLARHAATLAGAAEAWMVEDGFVTEGAASTAFIVTKGGVLVSRELGTEILHGTTRASVLDVARAEGIPVEVRRFTVDEALNAAEAFFTGASSFVVPIVTLDDRPIGDGRPGPITRRLRELYVARVRAS